jgi:hypothetical protein
MMSMAGRILKRNLEKGILLSMMVKIPRKNLGKGFLLLTSMTSVKLHALANATKSPN